jgi:hypothetical protein
MPLHPGDHLFNGQYRIVGQIGRGGFGFVYVAQHTLLGQEVAIKELIPGLVGDDAMLKRFLAEARATMRLTHERIVRTYEVFSEQENYYIAMEYMAGGSLEARLVAGALPVEEALRIVQEVAEGLAYAHEHGVVHCDLKPANILFAADGLAKVADFGIAHVSDQMLSRTWQTPAGFSAGTLPYMAPEQTEGVRDDPRVDVYALGAVLYRALAGRTYLEFDARETPGAQVRNVLRIQQETAQAPSTFNRQVPDWLDEVVLMALAKSPEARFRSARALLTALRTGSAAARPGVSAPPQRAAAGSDTRSGVNAAHPPQPRAQGAEAVARPARPARLTGRRLWLAAGGVLLMAAVLVGLVWSRSSAPAGGTATPVESATGGATTSRGVGLLASTTTPSSSPPLPSVTATPSATVTPPPITTAGPTGTPPPTATPLPTSTPPSTATPVTPTPVVGRVIFGSDRNGYAHIFTVRGDGKGLRAITSGSEYFWNPIFNNDGSRVAYVSKVAGNTEVFVARSDGSSARAISNHPAEDDHPAWFPGNNELAFASRRDGGWDIYRMNADGGNVRRLTADGGDNRFVAVSPDGAQIAYVSQNAPYPTVELMLMNADGSNRRPLFSYPSRKQRDDPGRYIFRPDWSADGTSLAFGADDDDDGLISVLVIDTASGQARRLIQDGNSPDWSPDGLRLIYKPAGERQILYVADAAGNRLNQLTQSTSNSWSPDWVR